MRQFGGFEIGLVAVIVAGVGVFAFSLMDGTPEPLPPVASLEARRDPAIAAEEPSTTRHRPEAGHRAERVAVDAPDAPAIAQGDGQAIDVVATPTAERGPEAQSAGAAPHTKPLPAPRVGVERPSSASERADDGDRASVRGTRGDSADSVVASTSAGSPAQSGASAAQSAGRPLSADSTLTAFGGGTPATQKPDTTRTPAPSLPDDESDTGSPSGSPSSHDEDDDSGGLPPPIGGNDQGDDEEDDGQPQEPPPPTPIVLMAPSATNLGVGEHVAVDVRIQSATNVGHVPFHVLYDPAVLQFDRGEEGPFLKSDGHQTAFFAAPSRPGIVMVGLSRLGQGSGISGDGGLCTLHFEAVGSGATTLAFERQKVRSADHEIVNAVFQPATLVVY